MQFRPHGLMALGMILAVTPTLAQNKPPSRPAKPNASGKTQPKPPSVTANDPVSKIAAEYQSEQNAFFRAAPKDEKAQQKYYEKYSEIPKRYLPIFKQAAVKHKGTAEGAQALLQIMQVAPAANDRAAIQAALTQLSDEAYLGLPLMEQAALQLRYTDSKNERDAFLKKLIDKSPLPNVKAAAIFVLAAATLEGRNSSDGDPVRDNALQMLRDLQEKYADTRYGKEAGGYIFEAENLQIGKTAPDIEGEDQDGKKFRLSEYRGKVVVLDFWGFW